MVFWEAEKEEEEEEEEEEEDGGAKLCEICCFNRCNTSSCKASRLKCTSSLFGARDWNSREEESSFDADGSAEAEFSQEKTGEEPVWVCA